MAVGRQDYQAGVVPVKSGYSLVQTPYFDSETSVLDPEETNTYCEYTVPAGYQLMVGGYRISSNKPYIQAYTFLINAVVQIQNYFDMLIMDNLPENSPLKIAAGQTVGIFVGNSDEVAHTFTVTLFGYLEQIET